jgi:lipopolysaccharide export system permease protein
MFFLLIDRYISRLFLGFFSAAIVVLVTLFVVVDFMTNLVRHQADGAFVLAYYGYLAPGLVYQLAPVACLMATVMTLANLSRNNELTALFAAGMSLARVSLPILVLVTVISAGLFLLNDRLVPTLNQRKNYIYFVEIRKQPGLYSTVRTNRIWYRSGNTLFNIKTLQTEKRAAQGLTMYFFDPSWRLRQMITAESVSFEPTNWLLKKGSVTVFRPQAGATDLPQTQSFDRKSIVVAEDVGQLQNSAQTADTLSLAELARFISRNKEAGLDTLRYEVDYHAKFSFAFAAFVMSLLGIPFSVARVRSGGVAASLGWTLLLAFGYWALYSSGITLGNHAALPPVVAVWVPNLVALLLGLFLVGRLRR